MRNIFFISVILTFAILLSSCGNRSADATRSIAVFVPGVLEGSPTYELMDIGVRNVAAEADVEVKTIEGGFDQASWGIS